MVLSDRRSDLLSMLAAGAVGALAFHFCIGFHVLDPGNIDWMLAWGHDPSANFIGWHMLRSAPWTLPPGAVPTLGYPVGTSVALTDSIPLVAIVLKVFRDVLPGTFQYFGFWLFLCFVLQGVFAALLLGEVTTAVPLRVLGAVLFVLSPVIAHRVGHIALCAHWVLLAALWLNRRQRTGAGTTWQRLTGWGLLVLVTAGTHPYLTVMVLAIAVATILGWFTTWRDLVRGAPASLAVVAGIAAGAWWAGGYFVVPGTNDLVSPGFGRLSMNALAPLIPPPGALTYGRIDLATAFYEQHEGFSYLGLGVALLLVVGILLARPHRVASKPDLLLGCACVALTLLALSPVVTIGTRTVFEYPPDWWGPLATFRASGRMFWPVLYAIIFASFSVVVRKLSLRVAVAVLSSAAVLQAVDIRGVYRLARPAYDRHVTDPLQSRFWDSVPRTYRHIVLHPSNMCAPFEQSLDYRFFALRAGPAGATINGGFAARYDADAVRTYCEAWARDLSSARVSQDTLYVVSPSAVPMLRASVTPVDCVPVDGFGVCFTVASQHAWATEFAPNEQWLPPLDELHRFRESLEAVYRDRLERPAVDAPGSAFDRMDVMARYLGYRVGGCDGTEALEHALAEFQRGRGGRLCHAQAMSRQSLPAVSELRDLQAHLKNSTARLSATHVDPEGEVVWTHAYVDNRLRGESEQAAMAAVVTSIRQITGR